MTSWEMYAPRYVSCQINYGVNIIIIMMIQVLFTRLVFELEIVVMH